MYQIIEKTSVMLLILLVTYSFTIIFLIGNKGDLINVI